jgi:hypothetical protein
MTTLDHHWRKMNKILSAYKKLLEEDIIPKNKISQEMVRDIGNQIHFLRVYLLCAPRTPETTREVERSLNKFGLDVSIAAELSGVTLVLYFMKSPN